MLQSCMSMLNTAIMLHVSSLHAASCVQVPSAFVQTCLFHVPVTNTVTVLVVPQMLWAAASWILTDMTSVLAALCTDLSSIGWASECAVLRRSSRACNVTQLLWSRLLQSGLPAATSGCVKSLFWAALASHKSDAERRSIFFLF